jgi:hypothetical protein
MLLSVPRLVWMERIAGVWTPYRLLNGSPEFGELEDISDVRAPLTGTSEAVLASLTEGRQATTRLFQRKGLVCIVVTESDVAVPEMEDGCGGRAALLLLVGIGLAGAFWAHFA